MEGGQGQAAAAASMQWSSKNGDRESLDTDANLKTSGQYVQHFFILSSQKKTLIM